jgi:hypothetical protein
MVKAIVLLVLGAVLGAGGVYHMLKEPVLEEGGRVIVAPQALSCESELASQRSRIAELENRISSQQRPASTSVVSATAQSIRVEDDDAANRAVSWRVSAIEKFVPISKEQKERLQDKFKEEREALQENRESKAETLEEIIGDEQAATYRQQVQAAFERAQNQELDKEAVWISRKLSLTADQEQTMRTIFSDVESQIDKEYGDGQHGAALSAQQRVARMVAENKRRIQLRSDALKRVLHPDQYTAYIQEESQSAASDVEVFHDAGGSGAIDAK